MKKNISLILLLVILIPVPAYADGVSFLGDADMMLLQPEMEQAGAIFYENGYENLLLSVSLDWSSRGNRSVWIVPVPASPENVKIDMVRGFPTYGGNSITSGYYEQIARVTFISAAYATFPLTTPIMITAAWGISEHGFGFAGAPPGSGDVMVWNRVEKMGMTSELVTAKDGEALEEYLASRGLDFPESSLTMFDDYTGKDYSFVITSIDNVTAYREQFAKEPAGISGHTFTESNSDLVVGISVRFPTDRIYFPLRPTRAYGSREVPVLLTVNGHVTPRFPDNMKYQYVDYLQDPSYSPGEALSGFFNSHDNFSPWPYTKIRIYGPADTYTDDLWMDKTVPPDVTYRINMTQVFPLIGVLLYPLFSVISAVIAGLMVFGRGTVPPATLAKHGLWNCASLPGFVWTTRYNLPLPLTEKKKRPRFVLVFYLTFLCLLAGVMVALIPETIMPLVVMPMILLVSMLLGGIAFAQKIFTFTTGHEAYMPTDGTIIWGIALTSCLAVAAITIVLVWKTREFLLEE